MKKTFIVVISVFIAMLFAAPSFALDLTYSGSLYFEGIYNENASSSDTDKADSYRNMRLRIRAEGKVTDNITLITRFDALDKVLSSNDSAFMEEEDDDNIDFDRAYAKIITPIGLFMLGRQEGVTWGTSWSDDEADTDRIKYVLPIPVGDDKFYVGIVAEKVTENDKGYLASNKDNDKYYISGTYVSENFRGGLLWGFYHFNTFQDPGQAVRYKALNDAGGADAVQNYLNHTAIATNTGTTASLLAQQIIAGGGDPNTNVQYLTLLALQGAHQDIADSNAGAYANYQSLLSLERGATSVGKVHLLSPYFTGKFGNLGISTELDYVFGTAEYKNALTPTGDRDVNAMSFNFEVTYDISAITVQLGYGMYTGDANSKDDEIGSMGFVSPGLDWGKMFILSNDTHGMNTTLGNGLGNHVGDGFGTGSIAMLDGFSMIYFGLDYKINDNLTIGTVMCTSAADDTPAGVDDDQGMEIDLNLSWKFLENLEYSATAAYLMAGDYWKERSGMTDDAEDTIALYHKVELTF